MPERFKKLLLILLPLLWLTCVCFASAQDVPQGKSMSNRGVVSDQYTINSDGTVTSQITSTVHYVGTYHRVVYYFSRQTYGNLSNVKIWDLTKNIQYRQASQRLDALDPNSWGQFAVYQEGDNQYFEWYFQAENEDRQWRIQYDLSNLLIDAPNETQLIVGDTNADLLDSLKITISAPVNLIDESSNRSSGLPVVSSAVTNDPNNPLFNKAYEFTFNNLQKGESYNALVGIPKGGVKLSAPPATASSTENFTQLSSNIKINSDTSVNVSEAEAMAFTGNINSLSRSIILPQAGQISDIAVADADTGANFTQAGSGQNPGTFTVAAGDQAENVTWYFTPAATKNFILSYKILGAVFYGQKNDGLTLKPWWGLPADAQNANATVIFPKPLNVPADSLVAITRTSGLKISVASETPQSVTYLIPELFHEEGVNLLVVLPKDQISQTALLEQIFAKNYGVTLSLAAIILTLLICFIYWLATEKLPKGRGVVVAEYKPPQNLSPAMAEIVCKEKLTYRGLSATIVDLAQRGYLKIEPDKGVILWLAVLGRFLLMIVSAFFLFLAAFVPLASDYSAFALIMSAFFTVLGILSFLSLAELLLAKEFKITKLKPAQQDDPSLQPYEFLLLCALFGGGSLNFSRDIFSTGQEKKSASNSDLLINLNSVRASLYEKSNIQTQAFSVDLNQEAAGRKKFWASTGTVFYILFQIIIGVSKAGIDISSSAQPILLIFVVILCALITISFIKFEARLNKQGRILKEEWQGFALYLTTTEKFSDADLTSNVLEPYLPYAVVFGAKNQFAASFNNLINRLNAYKRRTR